MTATVEFLDQLVVGVVVRDKEGAADGTAVGVGAVIEEDIAISFVVEVVNGAVKGQHDHLWDLKYKGIKC